MLECDFRVFHINKLIVAAVYSAESYALVDGVTFLVAFSTPIVLRVLLLVRVFIFLSILVVK